MLHTASSAGQACALQLSLQLTAVLLNDAAMLGAAGCNWELVFVTTTRLPVQLLVEESRQLLLLGRRPQTHPADTTAAAGTGSGAALGTAAAGILPSTSAAPAVAAAAAVGLPVPPTAAAATVAAAARTAAVPIHTIHLPGLLSMQLLAEEVEGH